MATGTPPNENPDSSDYVNVMKFAYQKFNIIQIQRKIVDVKVWTQLFKKITLIHKKGEEEGEKK